VNWDVSMHWSTLWFGLVVMHPWFIPSSNLVKHISSLSAYRKRCCTDRPIWFIFSQSFSCLGANCVHTFQHFKWSCIMVYAKPWEHPVESLHCLSFSSCQLKLTFPLAAQFLLSQSQQRDLVGHHLWLSNSLERISRPSCELLYKTNDSHHKQESFFMNILFIESICPQKNAQQNMNLQ
jgi:hypothetical protein